jgi:hypothetical protein
MRYFAVWREEEKIKIIEPTLPIENALYWNDVNDELSIYLKMIPIDADVIQAKDAEEAIRKFIEYEKREAGQ